MKVGIQTYLFRKEMKNEEQILQVISRLSQMGYDGIELFHPLSVSPQKALRAAEKAKLINPHVESFDLIFRAEETLCWAKEVGAESVCFSCLMPFYKTFGVPLVHYVVQKATETFDKSGIKLCYHNHKAELLQNKGAMPVSKIIEHDIVCWELDAYWAEKSGMSAENLLMQYEQFIPYLHVKDEDEKGRMCPIGCGLTPIEKVVSAAKTASIPWTVVDLDKSTEDKFLSAQKSLEYLRKICN